MTYNHDAERPGATGDRRLSRVIATSTFLRAIVVIVVAAVLGAGVPAVRGPVFRGAGRALVVQDSIQSADVIVVTAALGGAGVLEAADLVQSGIAPRVAIFVDPPDTGDRELLRRGIAADDAASRSVRQLKALGVEVVDQIVKSAAGTEEEARLLPDWCDERDLRSIIVITTTDHSRRLRRMFGRAMESSATKVAVRASRYSEFDPDRWWQTRDGVRTGIVELQKLLLDLALHPIS